MFRVIAQKSSYIQAHLSQRSTDEIFQNHQILDLLLPKKMVVKSLLMLIKVGVRSYFGRTVVWLMIFASNYTYKSSAFYWIFQLVIASIGLVFTVLYLAVILCRPRKMTSFIQGMMAQLFIIECLAMLVDLAFALMIINETPHCGSYFR